MNRLIQLQTHTFRLLLYLEWILLGITLLLVSPLADFPHPPFIILPVSPREPLLLFLSIACFGAMGLRLPKVNLLSKLLYIGLAFGLILLIKEVRQSVATLRYNPLPEKSLESAIALLLADFQRRTDIFPDCTLSLPQSLSAEIGTTIYRIVQEALTNISKHSTATQVKIDLQVTDDSLYLQLCDNGKGFNPNQNTTGFGIQGMRERTLALGGQFHIVSTPKAGCQIIAWVPLSRLVQ